MVTYSDLFQFGILIVGIISLVLQVNKKKYPPSPQALAITSLKQH